jgi:hypothetical protein
MQSLQPGIGGGVVPARQVSRAIGGRPADCALNVGGGLCSGRVAQDNCARPAQRGEHPAVREAPCPARRGWLNRSVSRARSATSRPGSA